MIDQLPLLLGFTAGLLLGTAYFLGLWWTLRWVVRRPHAGAVLAVSWLGRTAIVVGGFLVVARGDWRRLVACLVGFLVGRSLIVHRIGIEPSPRGGDRCT